MKQLTAAILALCMLVCLPCAMAENTKVMSPIQICDMLAAEGKIEFELLPATRSMAEILERGNIPYSIAGLSRDSDYQALEVRFFPNGDTDFIMQLVLHRDDSNIELITNALCSYEDEAAALQICDQVNMVYYPLMCLLDEESHTLSFYGQTTYLRPEDAGRMMEAMFFEYIFFPALMTTIDLANSTLNTQIDPNI
ncbi:MAG: hypothetical protein Q4E72_06835 [bacterium]|nr:hypothetical protein [bacterium]